MALGRADFVESLSDGMHSHIFEDPIKWAIHLKMLNGKVESLIGEATYLAQFSGKEMPKDDRVRLLKALAAYDSILYMLPSQIRACTGGSVRSNQIPTNDEKIMFLEHRAKALGLLIASLITKATPQVKSQAQRAESGRMTGVALFSLAAWCVVLACVEFDSIWIYQLSRWAICSISAWAAYNQWRTRMRWNAALLALVAVLFNPISPISFDDDEWVVVDWITAAVFFWHGMKMSAYPRQRLSATWRQWTAEEKFFFAAGVLALVSIGLIGSQIISGIGKARPLPQEPPTDKIEQPETRKYPRALPGGGLDWTGVEDGPRE
jgi:hypothetical protein